MNAVTIPGNAAQVELTIPAEIYAALSGTSGDGLRSVESTVSSALEGLAKDLGFTRSCSTEVQVSDNSRVTVSVDGRGCPYPRRFADRPRAFLGVLGQEWYSRTADLSTLLLQYAGAGDGKSVAALLAALAVEAVNVSADVLLPADAGETASAQALQLTRRQGVTVSIDAALRPVTSPPAAAAVTQDTTVAEHDANSQAEALIARLASGRWEVLINPRYLKELAFHHEEFSDFPELRERLYSDLGIRLPRLTLTEDKNLGPREFAFQAFGIRTPPYVGLPADGMLQPAADHEATAFIPLFGKPAVVTTSPHGTEDAVGPIRLIALALYELAWDRAPALVTTATVLEEISSLRMVFPLLADAADQLISPWLLTRLLRSLVAERISIQDLQSFVQVVLDERIRGTSMPDEHELLRRVRLKLRSRVCSVASRGTPRLTAHRVPESIARRLREGREGREDSAVAAAVSNWAACLPGLDDPGTVVLTAEDLMIPLRSLLGKEYPGLPVLTDAEIAPEAELVLSEDARDSGALARPVR